MAEFFFGARRLAVGYDGRPLIRDIDLDIRRGEIVALIGPNGAGKSTILKTVSRQLAPLGGAVYIGGAPLERLSRAGLARRMAVLLTGRARPELMTCRDVVAMGRHPYTGRLGILAPRDRAEVDAAMRAVRVEPLADCDFNAVSDGQRQRVLLARALCQRPEIIVLDEPTSYLDVRHKLELLGLLRDLARREGIAVLLSLHEIDLAQKLADRVLCVRDGRVVAFGAPEEVFDGEGIRDLFDIERGGYDPLFGSLELPPPEGPPRVFVLCGGGVGAPVFRALQRRGVPFAAGILHENDVDFRLARCLAAEVVSVPPFQPVSDDDVRRARRVIDACGEVIDARPPIGPMNALVAALSPRDAAPVPAGGRHAPVSPLVKE